MIKKFYVSAALIAVFFMSGSMLFAQEAGMGTNFFIGGSLGLGYAPNSSMDDAVAGYGDSTADALNILNGTTVFEGKNDKAGFAIGADLEARLLVDTFGVGCTIGYQSGGTSTSTAEASGYKSEQSLSLDLTAIDYLVTLYYRHVIDENSFVLLGGGLGYYQGTMTVTEEAKGFVSGNFKNEVDFTGSTIGGHLKLEYNLLLGSIDIFGGVMGRYATIDKFKKDGYTLTSSGDNVEGSFTGVMVYLGAGLMF